MIRPVPVESDYFAAMAKSFWQYKWVTVVLHVLTWAIMFSLPYLLKPDRGANDPKDYEQHKQAFIVLFFIVHLLWLALFYVNAFLFIPKLAYKRKVGLYILSLAASVVLMLLIDVLYFRLFIPGVNFRVYNYFAFNTLPIAFVLIASTAYRLIIDRVRQQQREKDRVAENLKTELSLLRSQVSPHFMFNVLNNMVALARKKSDLLEPSLMKLSQLLRYMLYETHERVPLQKEVEYLQSYIDLQAQRFGKSVDIRSFFQVGDGNHSIEPMLLIPYVENAFKHGVSMIQDPSIEISLFVRDKKLNFHVRNKFRPEGEEVKDEASGIGMVNVERRLKLLYPDKHQLRVQKQEPWFDVQLQIDLI
jgi:two-component system, LytTR family, sensor kinase